MQNLQNLEEVCLRFQKEVNLASAMEIRLIR